MSSNSTYINQQMGRFLCHFTFSFNVSESKMNSFSIIFVVAVAAAAVSATPVVERHHGKSGKPIRSAWQDLSEKQQQCLIDVFKGADEDVKRAMRQCKILDQGSFGMIFIDRRQFHQHFTSSFCANFLSIKKYKPKP